MPLKVNPITGLLDLVGVTTTSGDLRYLKLDASNDPVTGYLSILERLGIAELEPTDRFNVNSVGDIIAKGISSVVLNMKSATAFKVEAENVNDDVFVVDTATPLISTAAPVFISSAVAVNPTPDYNYILKSTLTYTGGATEDYNGFSFYQTITNSGNISSASSAVATTYGIIQSITDNSVFLAGGGDEEVLNIGESIEIIWGGSGQHALSTIFQKGYQATLTSNLGTTGDTTKYGFYSRVGGTGDTNVGYYADVDGATANYAFFAKTGDVELTAGNLTTTGVITAGAVTIGELVWVPDGGSIQTVITAISDASAAKPYTVMIPPGIYTEQITMKDYVSIKGSGMYATKITNAGGAGNSYATIFPADQVTISDMEIEATSQGMCIGTWAQAGTANSTFYVKDCFLDGTWDLIYSNQAGITVYISDVIGTTGYDGFTVIAGGTTNKFYIYNTKVTVANTSNPSGGVFKMTVAGSEMYVYDSYVNGSITSDTFQVAGGEALAGTLKLFDTNIDVAFTGTNSVSGVYALTPGVVEVYGGSVSVSNAGAGAAYDLNRTSGTLNVYGTSYSTSTGTIGGFGDDDGVFISRGNAVIGSGVAGIDYTLTMDGETTDWVATHMEDEDYLALSDDILMNTTENIYFRDTAISINSVTDGHLDLTADVSVDINSPILSLDGATTYIDASTPVTSGGNVIPILKLSTKTLGASEFGGPYGSGFNKYDAQEFFNMCGGSTTTTVFGAGVTSDAYRRFRIDSSGSMYWGDGTANAANYLSYTSAILTISVANLVTERIVIDDTNVEALLVRKDADAGDVFRVDTTNDTVEIAVDNIALTFGTANDATITFDGNSLNLIANAVTAADAMEFTAGSYSFNVPANTDIVTNWIGTTKSGTFTWLEDEGAFQITSTPLSTAWNNLVISDTTTLAAGVGGGIIFQGYWTGTSLTAAAGIKMSKTNATDADYSFGLDFYTRLNGSALAKSWTMKNSGELLQASPTNTVVAAYTGLTVNQKYNPASNDAANETGGASLKATVAGSSNAFNVTGALAWALYSGTGRVTGTIQGLNGYAQIASGAAAGTTAVLRAGNYAIDNSDADTIVTRASGLEIVTPVNAGTFTNTHGLYIFSQTAGTQTNAPWGIWDDGNNWAMDGDSAKLYFGEGQDAYVEFDGNSLNIIANAVTTTDALEFTAGSYKFQVPSDTDIAITFSGTTTSGLLTWMEDEDLFKFSDDIQLLDGESLRFGSAATGDVLVQYDGDDFYIDLSAAVAGSGTPDMVIKLADNADASRLYIWDSDEAAIAYVTSDGNAVFTGALQAQSGLMTKVSVIDVADPPTDANLDSAFGTPAALGAGFIGILDDNSGDTDVYICYTSDTSWYYIKGTKAV